MNAPAAVQKTLRDLKKESFESNPFFESTTVKFKKRYVRVGIGSEVVNRETGELVGMNYVHTIEDHDEADFVKVFDAGIAAMFDLTKSAHRVFQIILKEYQIMEMRGRFLDFVSIHYSEGRVNGKALDMSERTFQKGFKEIIEKKFVAKRYGDIFWVNPAMFFRGNRVAFIKEIRLRKPDSKPVESKDE